MLNYHEKSSVNPGFWLFLAISAIIMGLSPQAWAPYRYRHAIDDPLGRQKSLVLDVHGDFAVRGTKVHLASVRRMFNTGVKKLAQMDDLASAWRYFIHDDDVVALTFTKVGGRAMGTNKTVAAALLQSLYLAGFKPENFMLVGLEDLPEEARGTRPCRYGWQKEKLDFDSDQDYLAGWLEDVTAIINIPSLMDDNIIGLRGAMANLSWPMIKSPAKLYKYMSQKHGTSGDPFTAEIYALPQIRGKVRLHIFNALRILYYGGPEVKQTYVFEHGSLIFSTDPVAIDRVGLELIHRTRREETLPANVDENITAPYLETAQAMGLGYNALELDFIDYQCIRHEKE